MEPPLFFQEVKAFYAHWSTQFASVPKGETDDDKVLYQLAKGSRLEKFRSIALIDQIVRQGNYTHDEVFMLDADFVQGLSLYYYEANTYDKRQQNEQRAMRELDRNQK